MLDRELLPYLVKISRGENGVVDGQLGSVVVAITITVGRVDKRTERTTRCNQ